MTNGGRANGGSRCPWCGWSACGCAPPDFPDTWAGDLMLVVFAHRYCSGDNCSVRWEARWWEVVDASLCPWFRLRGYSDQDDRYRRRYRRDGGAAE